MPVKTVFLLCFLFVTICSIGQQDAVEWAKWGNPDQFHITFQRLIADTTILQGEFAAFYQDQQIIQGQFDLGRKEGVWYYNNLYSEGLRAKGAFHRGLQQGEWQHFHPNGSMKAIKHFQNGKEVGIQESYYKNGHQRMFAAYSNQSRIRHLHTFYASGDTALTRSFAFQDSVVKGSHTSYYQKGPKFEQYDFYADLTEPTFLLRLENKQSLLKLLYLNLNGVHQLYPRPWMQLDGSYRSNFATGYAWEHLVYDNGQLVNVLQGYNQWGTPEQLIFNQDQDGFQLIRFQHNGDTLSIEHFKDGYQHGECTYFESQNRRTHKGFYNQGIPIGDWTKFDRNLLPEQTISFEDSDTIRLTSFRKEGILLEEQQIVSERLQGEQITYDYFGEVDFKMHFLNGLRNGLYTSFRKGIPYQTGAYSKGVKSSVWKTYNPRGKITWTESFDAIDCQTTLSPLHALNISNVAVSPFKYHPIFQSPELHQLFQSPFNQNIDGTPYEIRLKTGSFEGDALFEVLVEDTGHVIRINCISAAKEVYYQIALSILQQMPFMFPAYCEGLPQSQECIISFNFNPL